MAFGTVRDRHVHRGRRDRHAHSNLTIVRLDQCPAVLALHPRRLVALVRLQGRVIRGCKSPPGPCPRVRKQERPRKTQGQRPRAHEAKQRSQPGIHHRPPQCRTARLVRILQAQLPNDVRAYRRLGADATAKHSAPAPPAARRRTGLVQHTMAQRLLREARAVHDDHCQGISASVFARSPLTGEADAGNPPVRFGGRGAGTKRRPPYPYLGKPSVVDDPITDGLAYRHGIYAVVRRVLADRVVRPGSDSHEVK